MYALQRNIGREELQTLICRGRRKKEVVNSRNVVKVVVTTDARQIN
jgi:hypothetical protein